MFSSWGFTATWRTEKFFSPIDPGLGICGTTGRAVRCESLSTFVCKSLTILCSSLIAKERLSTVGSSCTGIHAPFTEWIE